MTGRARTVALIVLTMAVSLALASTASGDYGQLDLVSQGNGTSYGQFKWASPDGSKVIFESPYDLVASDTDSCAVYGRSGPFHCIDVYERSGGVTTLLSAGGNGDFDATYVGASADGSTVFFTTSERLTGADTDSQQDVYQRSGGVMTLVSTGPTGGNGDYSAYWAGASADGAHIYFFTPESLVSADSD